MITAKILATDQDTERLADAVNLYEMLAQRTSNTDTARDKLLNAALGLSGEVGEVNDAIKKHLFQGHALDKGHLIEEAGDVAWYLAELAVALETPLSEILLANLAKLQKRYPNGFEAERSVHREDKKE